MADEAAERVRRARVHREESAWAAAVGEAVESMERSAKGILALVLHELPKTHRLTTDHNIDCLQALRTQLSELDLDSRLLVDCAQALLWGHTWSSSREISQWAFDEVPITTAELFTEKDAAAVARYADLCFAALSLILLSKMGTQLLSEESG